MLPRGKQIEIAELGRTAAITRMFKGIFPNNSWEGFCTPYNPAGIFMPGSDKMLKYPRTKIPTHI